jgi:hypothetical protein
MWFGKLTMTSYVAILLVPPNAGSLPAGQAGVPKGD